MKKPIKILLASSTIIAGVLAAMKITDNIREKEAEEKAEIERKEAIDKAEKARMDQIEVSLITASEMNTFIQINNEDKPVLARLIDEKLQEVETEDDAQKLAALISAIPYDGCMDEGMFFLTADRLLYTAVIMYMKETGRLMKLFVFKMFILDDANTHRLDSCFGELPEESKAKLYYDAYKKFAALKNTRECINLNCSRRLKEYT